MILLQSRKLDTSTSSFDPKRNIALFLEQTAYDGKIRRILNFTQSDAGIAGVFLGEELYDFSISPDGVEFGKFNPRSDSYYAELMLRLDKKSKCGKGLPCKTACISKSKRCRVSTPEVKSLSSRFLSEFKRSTSPDGDFAISEKELARRIEEEENKIAYLPLERIVAIDPKTGKTVLAKDGDESSVVMSEDEVKKMKGMVITHNHPNGGFEEGDIRGTRNPLSFADITTASMTQAKEIRAVTSEYTYSMKPPPEGWDERFRDEKLIPAYQHRAVEVYQELSVEINAGKIDIPTAEVEFHHRTLTRVAKDTGCTYKETKKRRQKPETLEKQAEGGGMTGQLLAQKRRILTARILAGLFVGAAYTALATEALQQNDRRRDSEIQDPIAYRKLLMMLKIVLERIYFDGITNIYDIQVFNNIVTGKFSDRSKSFSFKISPSIVVYQPDLARSDSAIATSRTSDVTRFNHSLYRQINFDGMFRFDAPVKKRKRCTGKTSYACGASCINNKKRCLVNSGAIASESERNLILKTAVEAVTPVAGTPSEPSKTEEKPDYRTYTIRELKKEASARGIIGYSTMTKKELVSAIEAVESSPQNQRQIIKTIKRNQEVLDREPLKTLVKITGLSNQWKAIRSMGKQYIPLFATVAVLGISNFAYHKVRDNYRANFYESAEAARNRAEGLKVDSIDEDRPFITFAVDGFSDNSDPETAGRKLETELKKDEFFAEKNHFVQVNNQDFTSIASVDAPEPLKTAAEDFQKISRMLGTTAIAGRNSQSVELAAQVYAHAKAYPDKQINLVGHGAGGMVINEAAEILKKIDPDLAKNLNVVNIGTPHFGFTEPVTDNKKGNTGRTVTVTAGADPLNIFPHINPTQVNSVRGHAIEDYTSDPRAMDAIKSATGAYDAINETRYSQNQFPDYDPEDPKDPRNREDFPDIAKNNPNEAARLLSEYDKYTAGKRNTPYKKKQIDQIVGEYASQYKKPRQYDFPPRRPNNPDDPRNRPDFARIAKENPAKAQKMLREFLQVSEQAKKQSSTKQGRQAGKINEIVSNYAKQYVPKSGETTTTQSTSGNAPQVQQDLKSVQAGQSRRSRRKQGGDRRKSTQKKDSAYWQGFYSVRHDKKPDCDKGKPCKTQSGKVVCIPKKSTCASERKFKSEITPSGKTLPKVPKGLNWAKAAAITAAIIGVPAASYAVTRNNYRANFDKYAKEAEEKAKDIPAEKIKDRQHSIVFTVGGAAYADESPETISGKRLAIATQKALSKDKGKDFKMVFISNASSNFPSDRKRGSGTDQLIDIVSLHYRNIVEKGHNSTAVELAANVIAWSDANPDKQIVMIGHSMGGNIIYEAQEYLRRTRPDLEPRLKSFALGSVWGGMTDKFGESHTLGSPNDPFATNLPTRDLKSFDSVQGHSQGDYLRNPEVVRFIQDSIYKNIPDKPPQPTKGQKQPSAKPKSNKRQKPEAPQEKKDSAYWQGFYSVRHDKKPKCDKGKPCKTQSGKVVCIPKKSTCASEESAKPQEIGVSKDSQAALKTGTAIAIGAALVGLPVGGYVTARERYRSGFKESAEMAKTESDKFPTMPLDPGQKSLTFVAGGFPGGGDKNFMDQFTRSMEKATGRPNGEFYTFTTKDIDQSLIYGVNRQVTYEDVYKRMWSKAIDDGRSKEAVNLAALVYSQAKDKPDVPIDLVGHCFGGHTTAEAALILKEMGINNVRVTNIGTPNFGFLYENRDDYVTLNSEFDPITNQIILNQRFRIPSIKNHDINEVRGHSPADYLRASKTRRFLKDRWKAYSADTPSKPVEQQV